MRDEVVRKQDVKKYIEIYEAHYGVALDPTVAKKRLTVMVDFIEAGLDSLRKSIIKDEHEQQTRTTDK